MKERHFSSHFFFNIKKIIFLHQVNEELRIVEAHYAKRFKKNQR